MPSSEANLTSPFTDRRKSDAGSADSGVERRQFANSHAELSPEARELGQAIDRYKLEHRRRFITYEEMLQVVLQLGYQKSSTA